MIVKCKKPNQSNLQLRNSTAEFLIFSYQTGTDGVDVRVEDGTVWLSQKLIGQILDTTPENILMHLNNIYADEELTADATTKDFLVVQKEGNREVKRNINHYNLGAIIAVGYRVSSKRATAFRQWATTVLRDFALRGDFIKKSPISMPRQWTMTKIHPSQENSSQKCKTCTMRHMDILLLN